MEREQVREQMAEILRRQGKAEPQDDGLSLRELGFRSLDFSELALRVEDESGEEITFDASKLRAVKSVGDVLDFLADPPR